MFVVAPVVAPRKARRRRACLRVAFVRTIYACIIRTSPTQTWRELLADLRWRRARDCVGGCVAHTDDAQTDSQREGACALRTTHSIYSRSTCVLLLLHNRMRSSGTLKRMQIALASRMSNVLCNAPRGVAAAVDGAAVAGIASTCIDSACAVRASDHQRRTRVHLFQFV